MGRNRDDTPPDGGIEIGSPVWSATRDYPMTVEPRMLIPRSTPSPMGLLIEKNVIATVRIDYFKPTGKWYGEGSFEMELETLGPHHVKTLSVPDRIDEMRAAGKRPGLTDSTDCGFVWVVRVVVAGETYAKYLWQPRILDALAKELWR